MANANRLNLEGVVSRADLVTLVEQAGGRLRKAGREYSGPCPLHNGDNPSGFSVFMGDDGKQRWHCFSGDCGSGDAIDFVMKWRGCNFINAYKYLGGEDRTDPAEIARLTSERAERARVELSKAMEKAQSILHDLEEAQTWLAYHQALEDAPELRDLWRTRGVPDSWQDYWQLGYCEKFRAFTEAGDWVTPSLSIPIYDAGWKLVNVRHRLLNPYKPTDKYRPEKPVLKAAAFMADPDQGFDLANVLVTEGEIKSMVAYITLDDAAWQVLGIPGKKIFAGLTDKLKGHHVVVALDPDAWEQTQALAKAVKGKALYLPDKVDDLILRHCLDKISLGNLVARC